VVLPQELRLVTVIIIQGLHVSRLVRAAIPLLIPRGDITLLEVTIKQIPIMELDRVVIIRQEAIPIQGVLLLPLLRGQVLLVRIVHLVATVPNQDAKCINTYTYLPCKSNHMNLKTGLFL
jgi:hypothetical protein